MSRSNFAALDTNLPGVRQHFIKIMKENGLEISAVWLALSEPGRVDSRWGIQ
jgi:hypothetical protein